ncbi:MAG TPA: hypothetical protein VFV33_18290, partial [Gemmatimonadaceae bacterium]|nr:hypothetical protein [Gemmatimonadaceae bacterium]
MAARPFVPVRLPSALGRLPVIAALAFSAAACRSAGSPPPTVAPAVAAEASREALDARARLGGADYDVLIRNGRVIDGMG